MSIEDLKRENAELKATNAALERENAELKAASLKLQTQVNLMQTIFDSLSEGVVASNLEGDFLVANPSAQEISGMAPVEGAPEEWNETYGTFYADKMTMVPSTELPLYKAMRGETTDEIKLVLRNQNRPDGVLVSISGRPLHDETGVLIGGVISMRDVTQLEQVTKQLEATVQDLQMQNSLLDTVLNSISNGVIVANEKGEFLYFNPVAEEIVGIGATDDPPEQWEHVYGTFYSDKVTPFPSAELPLYRAIQGEITNDIEMFIRNQNRPNGVLITVGGRPLYDQSGSLIGGVVIFHDITQLNSTKRQLEATVSDLQGQNGLMDAILNSISDGIIVANKDGKYVLFNKTAKKMGGQDEQEFENVHISQASEKFGLFCPESEELFPTNELPLARALQGEYADNIEMLIHNPQLPERIHASISGRPIYDEKGVVTGAVSAIRDISGLKTAEKRLKAVSDQHIVQNHLLQSIFDSMADGVLVSDETGKIIMANPSSERIVGLSPFLETRDQWLKRFHCFYPDKVSPFPIEELPLLLAAQGESTDNVQMFIRTDERPDGIHVDVSGRPLQDSAGNWKGGVVIFHDITDRVKTEEALAQAFAQGRLEIVDTILHNIGNAINSVSVGIDTLHHQLTNDKLTPRLIALANAIESHQDNLSDYIKNDPQGQKVLPFILMLASDFDTVKEQWKSTVQRIKDRTGHIVDIIRTQDSYNTTGGTRKDINLTDTISGAVKILKDSINKRQIQIEIKIDSDNVPKEIRIQESHFHQMLVNLIKNSIEAIDELAKLGEPNEAPRIQFRVYTDSDFLSIDVTDNGIGIEPEDIQRVFSAGFTTKEYGSGLGLHSSANFVIGIGGQIQPLSEGKGKGATMHVTFPYSAIQSN